ncbi:MAG: DUF4040 domain-containing protein [Firmicutes bacterium]|nr:DUF4040 domain-containing protein [Bacillota bacterium]
MIDIAIPLFLVACGLGAILVKDLMSAIMIFCVYSLAMAIEWARLNAVDVAITEASVGAGISTVLFIAVLSRVRKRDETKRKIHLPALVVSIGMAAILLYGSMDLPNLRDPNIPPSAHVVPKYLADSYEETGVVNVVAAILASYRGYDTLGETVVVATAGLCVILLLRQVRGAARKRTGKKDGVAYMKKPSQFKSNQRELEEMMHPDNDVIRRTVVKFLIPFIQLFGLYVIAHGELGPGGGFQGGVILGVSVIVYSLVFTLKEGEKRMSVKMSDLLVSKGALIYGGIGVACLFLGGNYLQYNVLFGDPKLGSHLGILGIEIGVGITVAAVMITLFNETIRRDDDND